DAPAPGGRGRYDRRASASERARQQRTHLLLAVERLARQGAVPSVAEIAACAGVGKNTFYEHFQGAADALLAAVNVALVNLRSELEQVSGGGEVDTPSAYAEQLAQCWISWCQDRSDAFVLLEEHARNALHTTLHE